VCTLGVASIRPTSIVEAGWGRMQCQRRVRMIRP
jgi:hypothetical protein